MDNRRRRGRADRIRVAGGERYEAQLVARKFRVGLAVVLSVILVSATAAMARERSAPMLFDFRLRVPTA
jgi:hypothetical protein